MGIPAKRRFPDRRFSSFTRKVRKTRDPQTGLVLQLEKISRKLSCRERSRRRRRGYARYSFGSLHNPPTSPDPDEADERYAVSSVVGTWFPTAYSTSTIRRLRKVLKVSTRAGDRAHFQRVKDTPADGSSRPNSAARSADRWITSR